MTINEKLHRSKTHATGFDPNCPYCVLSEKRRVAAHSRTTKTGGRNGGRPKTESPRCPCGCGLTVRTATLRNHKPQRKPLPSS